MVKQSPTLAPRRLLWQIIQMQVAYYTMGLILVTFVLLVFGRKWNGSYVFSWEYVRADTSMGWTLALLWLLDSVFSVLILAIVVGRSKLALDFSLTLHGIHLIVVWTYSGNFPRSWLWWTSQCVSALVMVTLGIWMTQWRELRRAFFEDFELAEIQTASSGA